MTEVESFHIIEDNILFSMSSDSAVVKYNGTKNSRLQFNIPNMIHMTPNITDIWFSVNSAVIPASFYNINSKNNTISISSIKYTIAAGNYNITELITAINVQTNNIILLFFAYNSITNKTLIYNNGIFSQLIQYSLSPLLWVLGFNKTGTFSITATGTNSSITSPNCVNLLNIPRIFIRSSAIDAGNYSDETESQDVLAVIPNTSCINGVIHYTNFNGIRHLVELQNLSNFDIFITDDERNEIDFNGVPVFFTISITIRKEVIKPPSFNKVFSRALELQIQNSLKSLDEPKIYLN
jgi:hypothetical protein